MQLKLLGPLAWVDENGSERPITSAQQRRVLTVLAMQPRQVVSRDRLIDALWRDAPPASAATAVQVYISGLRKLLGPDAILTEPPGYRLGSGVIADTDQFDRLVGDADNDLTRGRPDLAVPALVEALSLWRGEPLTDLPDDEAAAIEAARLTQVRRAARSNLVDARLRVGQSAGLAAELASALEEDPLWERTAEQLMTTLYLDGRQGEALQVARDLRRRLDDELGIEPGPQLQTLEQDILHHRVELVPSLRDTSTVRGLGALRGALFGRERELDDIGSLLRREGPQLVTVTGPGGIGKTRLATEITVQVAHEYEDGAVFVELSAAKTLPQALIAIAMALGAYDDATEPIDSVRAALAQHNVLLVLDNLEQVRDIGIGVAAVREHLDLLDILCTSRLVLAQTGEVEVALQPLALPRDRTSDTSTVAASPAVQLFAARARSAVPGFAVTDANAAAVSDICNRLDGLPLALELAAAQTRVVSVEELAARLERHALRMATDRTPGRQHTLESTITWSIDLLSTGARELFTAFGTFVGGATLAAVEAVAAHDCLHELGELIDHNLVLRGDTRLSMLETIRLQAASRLGDSEHREAIARRHAEYFAYATQDAAADEDNLQAALIWANQHDTALSGRLACRLAEHLTGNSRLREAGHIVDLALALDGAVLDRIRLLMIRQDVSFQRGRHGESLADVELALALATTADDDWGIARAEHALGWRAMIDGRLEEAKAHCLAGMSRATNAGVRRLETSFLNHLGAIAERQGDHPQALAFYQDFVRRCLDDGDTAGAAAGMINATEVHVAAGHVDRAREQLTALGDHLDSAAQPPLTLAFLELSGLVHLRSDQPRDAASRFACALRLRREIEADAEWTVSIAGVGAALLATGRPDDAVALLGACDRLAEEDIAVQANPMLQLPFRQSVVATAREALGERYAIVAARLDDFPLQSVVDVALRQADEIDLQ